MKVKTLNTSGEEKDLVELPIQFNEKVRLDLIKRAFTVIIKNKKQPYGASPEAGKRASANLSRRRRKYRGSYGLGISRVPRKIMSSRGTRFNWQGAFAPGTVGGRKAHPPKAEKILTQKINKKERRKAIRSALAASVIKELVEKRGHKVPKIYPLIIEDDVQDMKKTKEIKDFLLKIGLKNELQRAAIKSIRAGKGKSRGRKYKKRKGPLIVVSKECSLKKAVKNIAGIDVEKISKINVELLAPGAVPGRLTLYTKAAIKELGEKNLFK